MAMMLRWRSSTDLPVDGSPLKPETFRGLASADAARVPLRVGTARAELGELFDVDGDAQDERLVLEGDLGRVSRIGLGMTLGTLTVRGDVGFRFAAEMTGGLAELDGSCLDWAGAEMGGGLLRIRGDAGDGLGAAYPGSRRGMREGVIVVGGNAGNDVGMLLRRGLIAVRGGVGAGLGRGLIAGTIFACGPVGGSPGVGMKRGTLVLLGLDDPSPVVPPTFAFAGGFVFPYLNLYQSHLAGCGIELPTAVSSALLDRYNGDLASGGRGEILVPPPRPVLTVVSPT
ncbi:formylmethanofuran dehydrogenase subunit C [Planctomyces sp. SH-PL62]|uniref:formylmethanofuran dehydrogenase subunit C n=1 Tax=Planctomyces sp. SH-PL62 TaxID=1636152 RepID=UPI00078C3690|nr:formylmethanofuran dehydrogenase subunit C [Planctomyces sp. SH-PL62]AMV36856.1 Formyltransferase/hydrolase complex Fhc subunit C [Planctomyces sp. SH-PL62]